MRISQGAGQFCLTDKEKQSAETVIQKTNGLCSFYAESGGILIGLEG